MPVTRNRPRVPTAILQASHSPNDNRSESPTASRSGKIVHHLDESPSDTSTHIAKKRRKESSTSNAPTLQTTLRRPESADAPFEDDPSTQVEAESSFDELRAQLNTGAVADAPAENGATPPEALGQIGPEMTEVISNIIDHSERVEQYLSMNAADDESPIGSKGLVFVKTGSRMKVESLPILDNLSTQILSTLAKSTYQEILTLIAEPDSDAGLEYSTVRSLFDHTKRVYTTKTPFLSPAELDLHEPNQIDILRKANLATFVSSIFGTQEIGFSELNEHFLEIFVPENGRLLKAQGSLFLDLKTQAFIASMNTEERSKTELLFSLFPDDMDSRLLAMRQGARGLAPSEQDFVKRVLSRRDILLSDINNKVALDALPEKYHWEDFLRDVSTYVSKNFESINALTNRTKVKGGQSSAVGDALELQQGQMESNFAITPAPAPVKAEAAAVVPNHDDFVAKAARAAQIALQGHAMSMSPQGPQTTQMHTQHAPQYQFQQVQIQPTFQQYQPPVHPPLDGSSRSSAAPHYGPLPDLPHVSQTAPTQVLYERARMAATAKASPTSRRTGLPSQRRPWTTEEENALMAGLDRVRGPHWSQILAMFGPGGTINESLKDRNQVQLKDKARNLKLFFLKSGIEVPYYLKYVTGDLKTRAPAQASKNEARERERQQGEEDKAHFDGVQGIMALAGAHPQFPGDPNAIGIPEDGQHYQIMGPPLPDQMSMDPTMDNMDPNMDSNLDPSLSDMQIPPDPDANLSGPEKVDSTKAHTE